jgi:hypothetical protein
MRCAPLDVAERRSGQARGREVGGHGPDTPRQNEGKEWGDFVGGTRSSAFTTVIKIRLLKCDKPGQVHLTNLIKQTNKPDQVHLANHKNLIEM